MAILIIYTKKEDESLCNYNWKAEAEAGCLGNAVYQFQNVCLFNGIEYGMEYE